MKLNLLAPAAAGAVGLGRRIAERKQFLAKLRIEQV